MSDDIDIDAFLGLGIQEEPESVAQATVMVGTQPAPTPEPAPGPRQLSMEGTEEPVAAPTTARAYLRALFYVSKTGGEGHVVVLHELPEGNQVLCNCKAVRNLARRPQGCWAMIDGRIVFGLPELGGS